MRNVMKFSVLGIGAAFLEPDMAASHGFTAADDMHSALLPSRLRRRMSSATRLALAAGERACQAAHVEANSMPSVFASIVGEINITDILCRNIAQQKLPISPTQFHNSVHNTAAGYWSIVTKNKHATQAIGAGGNTLVMGFLECHGQLQIGAAQVLLICYEESAPAPLVSGKQISDCAVAMVLGLPKDGEDAVGIYQADAAVEQQSWSAVAKALGFATWVQQQQNQPDLVISIGEDGWLAKVVKGA